METDILLILSSMFTKLQTVYAHDFTRLEFKTQTTKFVLLNLGLFLVPLLLGQPQLLVGSLVNFGLIYLALNFKKNELLPAIFLPSLATFLHGVIWGPLTAYMAVLMPLIWLGNAVFVLGIRYLALKKWHNMLAIASAVLAKTLLLFLGTVLLITLLQFPQALLTMMGILQLTTGLLAAALYLVSGKFFGRIKS